MDVSTLRLYFQGSRIHLANPYPSYLPRAYQPIIHFDSTSSMPEIVIGLPKMAHGLANCKFKVVDQE